MLHKYEINKNKNKRKEKGGVGLEWSNRLSWTWLVPGSWDVGLGASSVSEHMFSPKIHLWTPILKFE